MSLQSSNLFSLQILNLTVRCSLLITRNFLVSQWSQFTLKIIFRKKNSTCFLSFFHLIFLPLIVEHFYLQHNLYFNILYPNNSTSSSEEKKDQLDSCNRHDLIVSFSHVSQLLLSNSFAWRKKYEWFSTFRFLRWSQLWSHNSGIKEFEDTVMCLFPHRAFVEKKVLLYFYFS